MIEVNFGTITKIKLNSYHPLCSNLFGMKAIEDHSLNPYLDGSCRREPDFENTFPSISALCRQGSFATKLYENSVIVYLSLTDIEHLHYRLVAILKVKKRFETHYRASIWYRDQNIPIPSNCMVKNNPPKTFDHTISQYRNERDIQRYFNKSLSAQLTIGKRIIEKWNDEYQLKSEKWPTFLATKPKFNAITSGIDPPIVTKDDFINIMGRVPNTRTPNNLTPDQLRGFCSLAGIVPKISSR